MMGLVSTDLLSAPISKRSVSKYAAVVTSSSGCLAALPVLGLFGQRFNSSTGMAAAFLSAVRRMAA